MTKIYSAEKAKQMQEHGMAMQFEIHPSGCNQWWDCKQPDGKMCGWGEDYRYRIKPTETGATNEPKRLQVGKKAVVIRDSCGIFSSGEIVTIVEYESQFEGTVVFLCESENGKTGKLTSSEIKPYEESRPAEDPARIPVSARVRVVKNGGRHNKMPVGSEGNLIKDDHSAVPYLVDFGGGDSFWFEADEIRMIAVPVADLMHSHRHTVSDGTAGSPVKSTVMRTSNGGKLLIVSPEMANHLRGCVQPTESKCYHELKALRDYQRAQLDAYMAFFRGGFGELYRSTRKHETRREIRARLLNL